MTDIRASSVVKRRFSTCIHDVSIGSRRSVARTTMPVSPMPPAVAQNSSASSSGVTILVPVGVASTMLVTCRAKLPSQWWFLPWMSDAIAPPTLT